MKNYFPIIAFFVIIVTALLLSSCSNDENPVNPPATIDSNVISYSNLVVGERIPPFDTCTSGIDLYTGRPQKDTSGLKDAVLIDSAQMGTNFYFRSGELSADIPLFTPGYAARFKTIFELRQITKEQFDTVTVIPDNDNVLSETDFTSDVTESFRVGDIPTRTFGFYLKGKYESGITPNRVFGILYVESVTKPGIQTRVLFHVRINIAGKNKFSTTK